MIRCTRLAAGLLAAFLCCLPAFGQLVITKSDVVGSTRNSLVVNTSDSSTKARDLGNGSGGQSWDFSDLNLSSSTLKTDSTNYQIPAGQAGVASFPNATGCVSGTTNQPVHLDTVLKMETAFYYQADDDGGYLLGGAIHLKFEPARPPAYAAYYPAETTVVLLSRPRALGLPLPLSNSGATVSQSDTSTDPVITAGTHPKTTVNDQSYTLAGEGTLKLPGGATMTVIRVVADKVSKVYTDLGALTSRKHTRKVLFYSKDLTQVQFEVDTGYTSGTTVPKSWQISKRIGPALGVGEFRNGSVPAAFALKQNYPNPFNPSTVIPFDVRKESQVRLSVYNMLGQLVATPAEGKYAPGSYSVSFDGTGLASGVYLYTLTVDGVTMTKAMSLIR